MNRQLMRRLLAAALAATTVLGAVVLIRGTLFAPLRISAEFSSATAIYPGDEVRVAGVRVGSVTSLQPHGSTVRVAMDVDHGVEIPADARAVIVTQNLISARYVQLTPAFTGAGPQMGAGAVIPRERTAIPVEWDEVKEQLTRLATQLGPTGASSTTSLARVIDSSAAAMDGNGAKLRTALGQLAAAARIFAEGSGDVGQTIKNLESFVDAIDQSGAQIVSFEGHLATLTSVVNDNRTNLDQALTSLAQVVDEVQRFVADTRGQTSEQVQRLADVTQNLADHRRDIKQILHVAPNAIANAYNIYNPDTGSALGSIVTSNFSNPLQLICGAIGSVQNATAPETAKLCADYLGPALRLLNFNNIPLPINPYLMKSASPDNIIYADPSLAPGGAGASPPPPEIPPAGSAYPQPTDGPPAPFSGLPQLLLPAEQPPTTPPTTALPPTVAPAIPPSGS
ncbi:MAG: MCE family protein [Actinomycetota bacterium]